MIRRLYTVLYGLMSIPVGVGFILIYVTFPIWMVIWFFTGWWVYPPANALAHNIMSWLMVHSSMKSFLTNRYYTEEDWKVLKKSLRTQTFN